MAERLTAPGVDPAAVEPHCTCLTSHEARMRRATLRTKGLPCGSGATGACPSMRRLARSRYTA